MNEPGHWVLRGVETMTVASNFVADWNRTHLFNPNWPPHARFHDAWTIILGTALGTGSIYFLRKGETGTAALLPALFLCAQAGSFVFPGTGGLASEFPDLVPEIAGMRINEAHFSAMMLALTAIGYGLARREVD